MHRQPFCVEIRGVLKPIREMTPHPSISDINLLGGVTIKGKVLVLVTIAVTLSLASVMFLSNIESNADDEKVQIYDYHKDVKITSIGNPTGPTGVQHYVYLGTGSDYISGYNPRTNSTITNKTNWDTNKVLQLDYGIRLHMDDKIIGDGSSLNYPITVRLIAGNYEDSYIVEKGSYQSETKILRAGGLEGEIKIWNPNNVHVPVNWYKYGGKPSLNFLKVVDEEEFKSVKSPVKYVFTIGTGSDAVTSTINIKFDDSNHTPPENPSQSALRYDVIGNQNGYSVLDVSVDSKYAGTENYLLAIAKYEGSIVYNSYVKVPTSKSDKVRLAFSSDRLQQVILEIVSKNDAFGDSVPGHLAYCTYEANQT